MPENNKKHLPLELLKYRDFRNYIIGRFFLILAINMQATLISWKVYEITKDPFSIGLIGLIEFVPAFSMAFYAGHVIDRRDKRGLLISSLGGNVVLTLLLTLATHGIITRLFSTQFSLYLIFSVVFGTGILRAFTGPTSFALVGQLVPREKLPTAITWHSGSWQIASVTGPAIAGLLYASIGATSTFLLILGFMVTALFTISLIDKKPAMAVPGGESILQSIRQGFRFVWNTRDVLGAMSLDLFAVFFGGATALLPYFADVILKTGPEGLGILRAAPALGSVMVLLVITIRPMRKNHGRTMLFCVAGFGLCILVFGLSKTFLLSFLALFFSGILDGISIVVRGTILQLKTPEEMKGRVASLNSIFIMSSNELGAFESGFTARLMGVVPAVVFGGCMTILVTAVTWIKAPSLKKLEY